jgi:prevent-host-death family protein
MNWLLAEAKNKFSEVVRLAISEGPQRVTRRNDVVIIVSEEHYLKITGQKKSFKEFLREGPGMEDIDLTRDDSLMREIEL